MILSISISLLFLHSFTFTFTTAANSQPTSISSPSSPPADDDDGTECPGTTVPCLDGCIPVGALCCHASSETWWCERHMACGLAKSVGCTTPLTQQTSSSSFSSSSPSTSTSASTSASPPRESFSPVSTTTTTSRSLSPTAGNGFFPTITEGTTSRNGEDAATRPNLTVESTSPQPATCYFEIPIVRRQQREKQTTTTESACPTELTSATSVPGAISGSGPAVKDQPWGVVMLVGVGIGFGFVVMLV
ncbi:hypothetical protein CORC01_09086 [Colletotrichum orchidophilum]|uniref:GPI anchored serine-threonine rich protein n=1 Tax=Colletotrichum orchidophilum TaxID=1209926 RepID=A0A1G4B2N5_9PEZI|nr:uncharacterized protein CORC01_09086 [Colletotrichum orchidophilum]OHE95654.1 hypothetical protein CORC01_09086 [Colletotrichum orchidophilum]